MFHFVFLKANSYTVVYTMDGKSSREEARRNIKVMSVGEIKISRYSIGRKNKLVDLR